MARLITEERRVLTGSLHTVPDIHRLFNLHKCDWMARDPGTYSEEIVREFYASYAATLRGSISKRSKPLAQDPLTSTLDIVRSGAFQRNSEQREAMIHWLAKYIAADGERAEWVAAPRLGIRKATLTFVAKFFWLLVRNRVSPTKADNQVTWDRAVMVAALLCRDYGVPIWHCDRLVHPTGALDIGLIRDEANVAAPRREPQAASMGPSSSRSTPQLGAAVVPLARVQKLEAQMATLLHHIQPWMQKSIAESEARVEHRMEDIMDRKVQAVNNCLDAFEPSPRRPRRHRLIRCESIASLRSDVEAILAAPLVEP
ncbi:hypothetical protein H5410_041884 [Solanum commersonii]|uniref:Putative plant transposon protein domain-containing protein n=1 Tax=Solanum commersonii TaxID=4109 RepID=A0A9J5XUF7_SOLCO|nr:hypothetical protein H5410_041884 [Solanum commersonii]